MIETLLLKPHDAAKLLQISQRTLWGLTDAGRVPAIRLGRVWRYSREALQKWVGEGCQSATIVVQSEACQSNSYSATSSVV